MVRRSIVRYYDALGRRLRQIYKEKNNKLGTLPPIVTVAFILKSLYGMSLRFINSMLFGNRSPRNFYHRPAVVCFGRKLPRYSLRLEEIVATSLALNFPAGWLNKPLPIGTAVKIIRAIDRELADQARQNLLRILQRLEPFLDITHTDGRCHGCSCSEYSSDSASD